MAADGAVGVVGENKRQREGDGVPACGRWRAGSAGSVTPADDVAPADGAGESASSCGTMDPHAANADPLLGHAEERQLVFAADAPRKQSTAAPVALDASPSPHEPIAADFADTAAKRGATGASEALEKSKDADGKVAVVSGLAAANDEATATDAMGGDGDELQSNEEADVGHEDATNADSTSGDGLDQHSDADVNAHTGRPTDGSCSTDVSTAPTIPSRDKDILAASSRKKRRRAASSVPCKAIEELLDGVVARTDEKRAHLAQQEAAYSRGRERVAELEREFKKLTDALSRCAARKREHRRIDRFMRHESRSNGEDSGSESSSSSCSSSSSNSSASSSSSSSSSLGERRKRRRTRSRSADQKENQETANGGMSVASRDSVVAGASGDGVNGEGQERNLPQKRTRRRSKKKKKRKKTKRNHAYRERKRMRQFRDDVALRFQLLRTECQRNQLQVDKLVADMRREYMDSYLFAGAEF